jgi:hypothetical protein
MRSMVVGGLPQTERSRHAPSTAGSAGGPPPRAGEVWKKAHHAATAA